MKIPKNLEERDLFYEGIIKKCFSSQEKRSQEYDALRDAYLFGAETTGGSPFNKIYPHIDLLTSFLYASETTKFMIHLGANASEVEHFRVPVLSRAINDKWLDSNADRIVSHAITWSLVYNTMQVKLVPRVNTAAKRVEINPFPIHPSNFGVLREDLSFSDRQEAMVHSYYITKSQLEIDLDSHPKKKEILDSLTATKAPQIERSSGVDRLMMGAMQPLSQPTPPNGNVEFSIATNIDYQPIVDEELIAMNEIWIWDTEINDYRVVTRIKDGMTIYDRKNFFLSGEHPFIQFAPLPLPFYYWGQSEVAGLIKLQEWRNERVAQIRKLLNLQVQPPTAAVGFGIPDEQAFARFMEGSLLTPQDPSMFQGKVERFAPTIPADIYGVIHEIDNSFSEHSGLPNTVQGKGEVGVRSGKQTSELARLGSARIKKRSLVVEDALEKMATLYLKLMQKYDATVYQDEKQATFIAEQFTQDFVVKVDAHSNSPIFIEDKKELAFAMLKANMITRERAIELIDAPEKEILKREVREIEKKEQEAAQAAAQAEAQKEAAKNKG